MGPVIDANRGKEVVFDLERDGQDSELKMKLPKPRQIPRL
jgi:hypothetical protein